jgi:hypothetical protein
MSSTLQPPIPATSCDVMFAEYTVTGAPPPTVTFGKGRLPANGFDMSIGRTEPGGSSGVWQAMQRPAIAAR